MSDSDSTQCRVRAAEFGMVDLSEIALVALGSNLGDSACILCDAMQRLAAWSARPMLKSSLWQSSPVDCPSGSPSFVNAVVGLWPRAQETPESLLAKLQALEVEFGRRPKTVLNEARRLDLDLLTFGAETRASSRLTLPHPRAHLRRFVLQPLTEIAPGLVWPGLNRSVESLLGALPAGEQVVRLPG